MSESTRVQRWRNAKRQQGLEPLTIWLSHEDKARLLDMAQQWHQSPSAMIREALAQFNPVSPQVTATVSDTEPLRALIRDELAASPLVTATATAAVTATLAQELPALVRQIVEELALEAMGLPVTATYSDITDTEAPEDTPVVRKAGRARGEMRQRIVELLAAHPDGMSVEEMRVHLRPERPLGDTLQGMRRQRVVTTRGNGRGMRYFLA